jgi:ribonuclease E
MTKQMLIDATHDEETRVAIVEGYKLLEFDYESKFRKPLKGSIFLAKVTRVEPSLQAAFVNFGGNRHGFLPFSEIHPDYFRIPIADREALIAEQEAMAKEEETEEASAPPEDMSGDMHDDEHHDSSDSAPESRDREESFVETIEEIRDENPIEEIGGKDPGYDGDDSGHDEIHHNDDEQHDEEDRGEREPSEETFSGEGSPEGGEQPQQEGREDHEGSGGGSGENSEGGDRNEGRGRRGRFRRGGRGRHGGGGSGGRGRHRMAHSSRRVESFGGEEYDDDGGGDRFRFNLRRKYKIQEVIKRGQIMLVQVSKEERGNKGAAVSTYLSLPGRYCVLMPNSPRGGGVSRKIASYQDRARMRDIMRDLEVPQGMSVIVRTAGVQRTKAEIKRDLDYLMRLWDNIRELTLQSSAPAMVYEEADLIKRAVRDLYGRDIEDVIVAGDEGFKTARNFMKMLVPSHTKKVIEYTDTDMPLFHKFKVEEQIAEIGESQVTLPSGGYMVINQTEALVAIDVNSGKATKERHIEETALKTNLEAASELARQLRLRDLGGLIVVDFIDMEDRRNNAKVERRMRDALSTDRARIQMGRISSFGLMELSRQRLNPSLTESQFEVCTHCKGMGRVRTCDAMAIMVLRAIEEEGIRGRAGQVIAHVSNEVALYIMNSKRKNLSGMETRYNMTILIRVDETVGASSFRIETSKAATAAQGDHVGPVADDSAPHEPGEIRDYPPREGQGRREFRDRNERGGGERGENEGGGGRRERGRGGRGRGRGRGRDRDDNRNFDDNRGPGQNQGRGGFGPRPDDNFNNESIGNEIPPEDDAEDNRGNREEHNKSSFINRDRAERGDRGGRGGRGRHGGGGRGDNRGDRGGRGRGGGGRGNFGRDRGDRQNFRNDRPVNNTAEDQRNYRPPSFEPSFEEAPAAYTPPPAPAPEQRPQPQKQQVVVNTPVKAPRRQAQPAEERTAEHARNFETVNEPPKEKKRGWWSKAD